MSVIPIGTYRPRAKCDCEAGILSPAQLPLKWNKSHNEQKHGFHKNKKNNCNGGTVWAEKLVVNVEEGESGQKNSR